MDVAWLRIQSPRGPSHPVNGAGPCSGHLFSANMSVLYCFPRWWWEVMGALVIYLFFSFLLFLPLHGLLLMRRFAQLDTCALVTCQCLW